MKKQLLLPVALCLTLSGTVLNLSASEAAPKGVKPVLMAQPAPDLKKVLDALGTLHPKPLETLTPAEARLQPGPTDGVMKVLKNEGKSTAPMPGVITQDISVDGAQGAIPARVYTPEGTDATGAPNLPVIVYFHGGGWVIATLDTYDASARELAKGANAIVISIEYRKAPEYRFPAAHEDAFAAYKWALANAGKYHGDAHRIAVVGESAGGNLAANVSIMARDQNVELPVYEALIYPVAGNDMNTPSYLENAKAKPLNKPMMGWFFKQTLKDPVQKNNKRLDLVHANLKGLPPTTVITAQIDPLRSEGQALAAALKKAGVQVTAKTYPGMAHEFFGMGAVVKDAKAAEDLVNTQLKQAFAQSTPDSSNPKE